MSPGQTVRQWQATRHLLWMVPQHNQHLIPITLLKDKAHCFPSPLKTSLSLYILQTEIPNFRKLSLSFALPNTGVQRVIIQTVSQQKQKGTELFTENKNSIAIYFSVKIQIAPLHVNHFISQYTYAIFNLPPNSKMILNIYRKSHSVGQLKPREVQCFSLGHTTCTHWNKMWTSLFPRAWVLCTLWPSASCLIYTTSLKHELS